MLIDKIVLTNFRNLKSCTLNTASKLVFLVGENGQGKTNLLEAIYILCYGSSFRTQNLNDCISYNSNYLYLKNSFEDSLNFNRTTEFSLSSKGKSIKVDSKEIKDRKELIYSLPCIVFSHDDIEIVRGEPENRRKFFDQTMTMYDCTFFDNLRHYKHFLRQRNAAIKENRQDLLNIYDMKIAELGIPLMEARRKVCTSFEAIFPDIYSAVSQDNKKVNISYKPSWPLDSSVSDIVQLLLEHRDVDFKMQTSTTGPHRDRFVLSDENGLFANSASTGQMRLASLVFRSAQAAFFRQKTSIDPIFLIDDVLLELDSSKRGRYLQYLGKYSQAFFTFLPKEQYFSDMFDPNCCSTIKYNVKEGEFMQYEG